MDSRQNVDMSIDNVVSRGEAVHTVITDFKLAESQDKLIKGCLGSLPECFFAFSARSDFDGIMFEPLILYPDVYPAYRYYKDINMASMLGLVQGYLEFDKTPFRPEDSITRIQALKIVLGGANTLSWKERFELTDSEMTPKVDLGDRYKEDDAWWYARYIDFALDAGILTEEECKAPDAFIKASELAAMIEKTQAFVSANNAPKQDDNKALTPGDTQDQTIGQ